MTTVRRLASQNITATDTRALALTLSDAKTHIKVDWNEEDSLIEEYIRAATAWCEDYQGRRYVEGQVTDIWPAFPCRNLPFRWAPLRYGIVSDDSQARALTLAYYDTNGTSQLLTAGTDFYVMSHAVPPYIYPAPLTVWPSTQVDRDDAVQVTYWAGSTVTEGGAPAEVKSAIRFLVGHQYRNREPVVVGSISKEIEFGVRSLLGPKRLIPVA